LTGCSNSQEVNKNVVLFTVDKDGVYEYNCSTKSEQKIYTTDEVFISSSLLSINDSIIIVGHQSETTEEERPRLVNSKYFYRADGDSSFVTDTPPYTLYDKYKFTSETFYGINLSSKNSYKYKTIQYEHKDFDTLRIKTTSYNRNSDTIQFTESISNCNKTSHTSKGVDFCDSNGRYFSESKLVNGRKIISRRGDLILIENNKEETILKFDGHFDSKFGSGYYNPSISPDGQKVIYQYLTGFLKDGSAIFELDIKTKKVTKIIGSKYFNPKYSPDGKYILIGKSQRQGKLNTWIKDIYILNLTTGKKQKIGTGDKDIWKE
jgi:hypothetical protein